MDFKIGQVAFSDSRTVVIAEAGVNHLGNMNAAEKLISAAKRAGCDIIKFQTYTAAKLTTKAAPRFWTWAGEVEENGTQFDSYSNLDKFGRFEYEQLVELCQKHEIEFMSTPFDTDSVDMLCEVGVKGFKIASCDITNEPLLLHIASKKLPILLSTGASTVEEISRALNTIKSISDSPVAILHCTLTYPTPDSDANLKALIDLKLKFPNHLLGLSDHTLGISAPAFSVMLGSRIIEKHFTYDKTLPLSADHWLSVNEEEMSDLILRVRQAEKMLGVAEKKVLDSELKARNFARRSVVAECDIAPGEILTGSNISVKRPGTGISPYEMKNLIGKIANNFIEKDTLIDEKDLRA